MLHIKKLMGMHNKETYTRVHTRMYVRIYAYMCAYIFVYVRVLTYAYTQNTLV